LIGHLEAGGIDINDEVISYLTGVDTAMTWDSYSRPIIRNALEAEISQRAHDRAGHLSFTEKCLTALRRMQITKNYARNQ